MDIELSRKLIYQSIDQDPPGRYQEHLIFRSAFADELFYERFMPTDRSKECAWGISTLTDDRCPDLGIFYREDFGYTTDLRAQELAVTVERSDLPIVVCWSGGIDSTVILSALIKNWPRALLDRVSVKMNQTSYFENPWFFDKIIMKHGLKVQNNIQDWTKCFCFTGGCADNIWIQADIVEMEILHPGSSKWSIVSNRDNLIQWIARKSSEVVAHQVYSIVVSSAAENHVVLDTIEDFYWWWNFNFIYTGQIYKYLDDYVVEHDVVDLSIWKKQHLAWYHSMQYQLWSAANRSNGVKIDGTVRSYKWPAKQYIFEVDKNPWYRDYKTKLASDYKTGHRRQIKFLYDDGTLVI